MAVSHKEIGRLVACERAMQQCFAFVGLRLNRIGDFRDDIVGLILQLEDAEDMSDDQHFERRFPNTKTALEKYGPAP
jgi:hypothetical protein